MAVPATLRSRRRLATRLVIRLAIRLAHDTAGAAILEFALVLPILLALVAGCFELGRALLVQQAMSEAVRGGARYLAQVPDPGCRPACSPGAARAIAATRAQIVENARVSPASLQVVPLADAAPGRVGLRAEVALGVDLLGMVGLARVITLRATHQEARVAP